MPIQSVSLTRRQFMLSGAAASALCYSTDSGSAAQQSSHNHHLAGPSSDGFPFQRPRYASHCLRALVIPRGQAQLQPAPALTPAKPAAALAPDFSPSFSYLRRWRGHADNSLRSGLLAQQSTSL